MLEVLEDFTNWSEMGVNVKKCAAASYLSDMNRRRYSRRDQRKFKGQEIANLTLAESLTYLATRGAARRSLKLEAMETKLTEMGRRLEKIMGSQPLIT
jgi:DNA-binding HxlR family transcriptional regulator